MKLQKAKKAESIINQEDNFIVPDHWIEAAKIAKKVLKEFKNKVITDNFLGWNSYKKFEYFVSKKCPIYIAIRHTKQWLAQSLTTPGVSGYIKVNVSDDSVTNEEGVIEEKYFYRIIFSTLVHEIIHYFQDSLGLEEQLAPRERKKLLLYGNAFKRSKDNFLYATNWVEMDAELGTYFALHQFKVPSLKQIIQHYHDWYNDDLLATAIGTYIYNYFIEGRKNLSLRERLFNGEIKFNGELFG